MYASTGVLPKTLKLISAARLTGAQGIHRAENLAVLNCFEALREAVIHTNSAVTISMFEQCQQAVVEGDLLARSEFDLAARPLRCISPNSVPKKKSTQKLSLRTETISDIPNLLDLEISKPMIRFNRLRTSFGTSGCSGTSTGTW